MTLEYLTRDQVRLVDQQAVEEFGIPSLLLMENAGRGAAEWLISRLAASDRVLIFCGPGNNGGDGGVVARHLDLHGFPTMVVWIGNPDHFRQEARLQFDILTRTGFNQHVELGQVLTKRPTDWLTQADWVVDALLGTGLTRPINGPFRQVIEAINASTKPVLALDIPSGLDADTGMALGVAVCATATVTFVATKLGFAAPGAAAYTGPITVAHIGIPRRLLARIDTQPA